MSTFRPECGNAKGQSALPDDTALFLIRDAVMRRRLLIHGKLHDGQGNHCAIGAFWEDNPNAVIHSSLIDEVAAVNDSMRDELPSKRWKKVNEWLRWKVKIFANVHQ